MMQKESYEKIFQTVGGNRESVGVWSLMGKLITFCTVICYAATILGRILLAQWRALGVLLGIPALCFVSVSIFRSIYNARRPYEVYDFQPLIPKKTQGKSFPSRHLASLFVIAVTIARFYPYALPGLGVAGVILGAVRVVTGVHFPRDVIVGGLVGIFFGLLAHLLFLFI